MIAIIWRVFAFSYKIFAFPHIRCSVDYIQYLLYLHRRAANLSNPYFQQFSLFCGFVSVFCAPCVYLQLQRVDGQSIFCHYGQKKAPNKKVYVKIFELTTTGDNGRLAVDGDDNNNIIIIIKKDEAPEKIHWQIKTYLCMLHVFSVCFSFQFSFFHFPTLVTG